MAPRPEERRTLPTRFVSLDDGTRADELPADARRLGAFRFELAEGASASATLFWPPRPAELFGCGDALSNPAAPSLVPLAGDRTVTATTSLLVVDPRSGAAALVEREGATPAAACDGAPAPIALHSRAGADPLRLELQGRGATTLTFVADLAAWLRARGEEALAVAIERLAAASGNLALEVTQPSPRLAVVRWSGDAPASEREQEELAKVAASRRAGAHVLLAGDASKPLPRALERLCGAAPPIRIEQGIATLLLRAPPGRGRLFQLASSHHDADDLAAREREWATAAGATALAELADRSLSAIAERVAAAARDGDDPARDLLVAAPASATRFAHACDGGERVVVAAAGRAPRIGRLVRSREQFELTPALLAAPPRHSLVLERLTAADDFGALLRVELDDEDLGPWRLATADPALEPLRVDRFAIPSDLFAGRDRFRLAIAHADAGERIALRWRFFLEPEPDGSWLTDLEIEPQPEEPAVRVDEPARRLGRALVLHSGRPLRASVPRGYSRFVATIAAASPTANRSRARLVITTTSPTTIDPASSDGASIDLPLHDARELHLVLEGAADASLALLDPRLLRAAPAGPARS